MILKILLNIQTTCKMFTKILKNTIQEETVFDDMIIGMINNKKFNAIVTELFISVRKRSILLVFITWPYFKGPKDVRLSYTHYLIMKASNNSEL